jgi:uncharacterized protein with von Willebrand factor type A (vWA) domain
MMTDESRELRAESVCAPFGSLPENLAAFCDVLRRDHGFRIGPRELQDAARALMLGQLADEDVVRDVLRPVLSHTLDDLLVFDEAFDRFFRPRLAAGFRRSPGPPHRAPVQPDEERLPTTAGDDRVGSEWDATVHDEALQGQIILVGEAGPEGETGLRFARASYSALDAEGSPPRLEPPDPASRAAARRLLSRLRIGLTRRWKPAARGTRFDLRRTLRGSLHTGGEAVVPRWRARTRQRPRLVVLVDGSRSMGARAQAAMTCAVALASATSSIEVFTFSTDVARVTPFVRRAAAGERQALPRLRHAWGGGTSIGGSLLEFLSRWGPRLLGPDAVVFIASDGLDVGDPERLRRAMARVHRGAAAIVWLNPLVETEGFQPTAAGMRAVRPLITTLAWAGDAAGIGRLSRQVRLHH